MDDVGFEGLDLDAQVGGGVPEAEVAQLAALGAAVFLAGEDDAVGVGDQGWFVTSLRAAVGVPGAEFGAWGRGGFAEDPFGDEEAARAR